MRCYRTYGERTNNPHPKGAALLIPPWVLPGQSRPVLSGPSSGQISKSPLSPPSASSGQALFKGEDSVQPLFPLASLSKVRFAPISCGVSKGIGSIFPPHPRIKSGASSSRLPFSLRSHFVKGDALKIRFLRSNSGSGMHIML